MEVEGEGEVDVRVPGSQPHSGGERSLGQKKYIIGGSYIVGNVYAIRFGNS